MRYNIKQHLLDNITAIKTALLLKKTNGKASNHQIGILKKFSGFGGIKCLLYDSDSEISQWPKQERNLFPFIRELHELLKNELGEQDYILYLQSLRSSVLTAFYTPSLVAGSIVVSLKQAGVRPVKVLDPSAGTGEFISTVRNIFTGQQITTYAYEKDLLTALILSQLHPESIVYPEGFESISNKNLGTFDLVSSNIPFGNTHIFDSEYIRSSEKVKKFATQSIHNYFFLKSVDCLREGGILAFITSQFLTNSPVNEPVRSYLMRHCNLLGALRLPNNLFSDYANTMAGSDLIILQKYTGKKELSANEEKFIQALADNDINVNSLLCQQENIIATSIFRSKNLYGDNGYKYLHDGTISTIAKQIAFKLEQQLSVTYNHELFIHPEIYLQQSFAPAPLPIKNEEDKPKKIPGPLPKPSPAPSISQSQNVIHTLFEIYEKQDPGLVVQPPAQPPSVSRKIVKKNTPKKAEENPQLPDLFSVVNNNPNRPHPKINFEKRLFKGKHRNFYVDGTLISCNNQIGYYITENGKAYFKPLRLNFFQYDVLLHYVEIRNLYKQLSDNESSQRKEDKETRIKLNKAYDRFVKAYGDLNSRWNIKMILMDYWGRDTLTLESFKEGIKKKADIFSVPVAFSPIIITETDNVETALSASLNYFGKVNLPYILKIYKKSQEEIIRKLKGKIYFNPMTNEYETAEKFLSGDIIYKINVTETLLKYYPHDKVLEYNLKSLREVAPPQYSYEEIDFNFGERWIPANVYSDFVSQLFDTKVTINYYPETDTFILLPENENHISFQIKYAILTTDKQKYSGLKILRHALFNTIPFFTKTISQDGYDIKVADNEAIQLAASKITEIREEFTSWLNNRPNDFKENLVQKFNRIFNSIVRPDYNGNNLKFPGLQLRNLGIQHIYKTQKDCIWMLLQNKGGIVDHEVGLGKTLIMCTTAHEMKRMGLCNKPMIICLDENIDDIAMFYQLAYPSDKILYCGKKDFTPQNRIQVFNEIKNNNWDIIILTHRQFAKIPQSLEIQRSILQEQMYGCRNNMELMKKADENIDSRVLKGLEKKISNLKAEIETLSYQISHRYDKVADFREMNVDHLFVDECHQFKNLYFTTRHNRVAGLGNQTGSQRALNLLYAVRTIQARYKADQGVTFLTGTLISNSLIELYNWAYYLRPRALAKQGLVCTDAWLATYAIKKYDYEFSVTNEIIVKERFREFIKVQLLSNFHFQYTDYKTAKDANLDRPEPVIELVKTPLTHQQKIFSKKLIAFAHSGDATLLGRSPLSVNESKGKMLLATNYARKMSLDMRLIDPAKYTDEPNNKLSVCARKIAELYYEYDSEKGVQLVFCDLGTFKPDRPYEWNVYEELKRKLVEDYHIPASEICFIQEFKTEQEKREFTRKINDGIYRIAFGTTIKLGTGRNIQRNIVAEHDLDIPWTHKDLVQRHGRAIRTGNIVAKKFCNNKVRIFIYATENSLDIYRFFLVQNKEFFTNQVRSGRITTRRVDEGCIDEQTGCSYAEFIALLSGNTMLLNKTKIEKEIAALESEKHAFLRNLRANKYRYQDTLNETELLNTKIESLSQDYSDFIKKVKKNRIGKPIIELKIKGIESNNPVTLGKELQKFNEINTQGECREIGTIYGFPILVLTVEQSLPDGQKKYNNKFMVKGQNENLYLHNSGNLPSTPQLAFASFHKAMESIFYIIEDLQKKKNSLEKNLPVLKELANENWKKEKHLKNLKQRLQEVEQELNLRLQKEEKLPKITQNRIQTNVINSDITAPVVNSLKPKL